MTDMAEKRLVLPGEELGTTEEFLPGKGTYEEGGKIYSAVAGVLDIDTKEMAILVRPANPPVKLKVGDTVIGTVDEVRSSMVELGLARVAGNNRAISDQGAASVHVSHISENYVPDVESQYHLLDVVRAKVIQTEPSIQLSTAGMDFGVIRALCGKCRKPLKLKGETLWCEEDQRTEGRKLSRLYGSLEFWNPPTAQEIAADQVRFVGDQRPRRPMGGRGGGGGGRGPPWRGGDRRGGDRRGGDRRGGDRGRDDRGRRPYQDRGPRRDGGGTGGGGSGEGGGTGGGGQ
jgi:exosome complex component CSL4